MNAMMKEVTTKPTFCRRMVERSTTTVRNRVASLSNRDASVELELFISSNHPISFLSIAATKYRKMLGTFYLNRGQTKRRADTKKADINARFQQDVAKL